MDAATDSFLIEGARVFDGHRFLSPGALLVVEGRIAAVDARLTPPAGTPVLAARGGTVLPGLVDAHVHVHPGALQTALRAGVTTELDMFADPALVRSLRRQASSDPGMADLRSAGTGATAPGGHPTALVDRGLLLPFPTVAGPQDAEAFVADRVAEGSDHLKIVLEDGTTTGRPCPSLTADTVRALVLAAHARGLLVVAHTLTQAHALLAVDAGVDGLAHLFVDEPASAEFLDAAVRRDVFVVPTLTSLAARAGRSRGPALAADPDLGPGIDHGQRTLLGTAFPVGPGARADLDVATSTVGRLHRAGVALLAGTDASSPGVAHGVSLHDELVLLVQAGLSPAAALAAATSAAATAFRLADRGTLAPGRRADLVLVDGDPGQDITRTRAITAVWRDGRRATGPQVVPAPGRAP
ncbi:imidazolonepropionase-like amidohydrolase [Geodermatophilus bullaregiensis]|uniref:amidohydrolase family protein n=1 Tax=Geodermatophilus bullaregiensis TaxID=1564160 RepID=UPI001956F6AA|nr:amidohydrolase family protein [Geodermatophilus bullaregiensis]MBM7805472.1 imidazolonepropionase-like amidohydrolase [Geodermatophilus bullaregiensis]